MYMSHSASSSPTPRSTSRVMMTGLIGPDLRREDWWSGPSHEDWRKFCRESCRITWHYPTNGRVRTVTTLIACRPRILCSFPLHMQFPVEGLLSRTGGQPRTIRSSSQRRAVPVSEPEPVHSECVRAQNSQL